MVYSSILYVINYFSPVDQPEYVSDNVTDIMNHTHGCSDSKYVSELYSPQDGNNTT